MRGAQRAAALAGLLLLLSGCGGEELSHVSLVEALGVDGPGPVALTAVTGEKEVYAASGATAREVRTALKSMGEKRLALTHVERLVLGGDVPVAQTLWQETLERESGYGATVWLCDGPAGTLLAEAEGASGRLRTLEEAGAQAPTIMEALRSLSRGGTVTLPVLRVEEGQLSLAGYRLVEEPWDGAWAREAARESKEQETGGEAPGGPGGGADGAGR